MNEYQLDAYNGEIVNQLYEYIKSVSGQKIGKANFKYGLAKEKEIDLGGAEKITLTGKNNYHFSKNKIVPDDILANIWNNRDTEWLFHNCNLHSSCRPIIDKKITELLKEYYPSLVPITNVRKTEYLIALLIICRCRSYIVGSCPEYPEYSEYLKHPKMDSLDQESLAPMINREKAPFWEALLSSNKPLLVKTPALSGAQYAIKAILSERDYRIVIFDGSDLEYVNENEINTLPMFRVAIEDFAANHSLPQNLFPDFSLDQKLKVIKDTAILIYDYDGTAEKLNSLFQSVSKYVKIIAVSSDPVITSGNDIYIQPMSADELFSAFKITAGKKQESILKQDHEEMIHRICDNAHGQYEYIRILSYCYAALDNENKTEYLHDLLSISEGRTYSEFTFKQSNIKIRAKRINNDSKLNPHNHLKYLFEKYLDVKHLTAIQVIACLDNTFITNELMQHLIPDFSETIAELNHHGWIEVDENGSIRARLPKNAIILFSLPSKRKKDKEYIREKEIQEIVKKGLREFAEKLMKDAERKGAANIYWVSQILFNMHNYIIRWLSFEGTDSMKSFLADFHIQLIRFFLDISNIEAATALMSEKYDEIEIDKDSISYKALKTIYNLFFNNDLNSLIDFENDILLPYSENKYAGLSLTETLDLSYVIYSVEQFYLLRFIESTISDVKNKKNSDLNEIKALANTSIILGPAINYGKQYEIIFDKLVTQLDQSNIYLYRTRKRFLTIFSLISDHISNKLEYKTKKAGVEYAKNNDKQPMDDAVDSFVELSNLLSNSSAEFIQEKREYFDISTDILFYCYLKIDTSYKEKYPLWRDLIKTYYDYNIQKSIELGWSLPPFTHTKAFFVRRLWEQEFEEPGWSLPASTHSKAFPVRDILNQVFEEYFPNESTKIEAVQ